jgi:hypothetical protein
MPKEFKGLASILLAFLVLMAIGMSAEAKSYPTGLIVTPEELAKNREQIAATTALHPAGIIPSYPPSWDWRSKGGLTPVKDQGGCGACVAFAILATEESAWLINNSSQKYDLSEWYLFQKGRGSCSSGSQFERMLDAAKVSGTVTEKCCPYLGSTTCTSPLYRIKSWAKIYTIAEAKAYISTKGPLMSGMGVYSDFFDVDSNKIYAQEYGDFVGYHAICIVGYDDIAKCWIVKNSWSTAWGVDGYCRIAYNQCGIGTEFPFYSEKIVPSSGPTPATEKTFSARVISYRPSGIFQFGTTTPDDKWVLETTKSGVTGQIGTYPFGQKFGFKIKTSEGVTYYTDQQMNPDKAKHASLINLSSGRTWISWYGIARKYSSDVTIEVTSNVDPLGLNKSKENTVERLTNKTSVIGTFAAEGYNATGLDEEYIDVGEPNVRQSIKRTKIGNQVAEATGKGRATNNIKIVSN